MNRRTIPQIRARLLELAEEHGIDELATLAEETRRRAPVRQAKRRKVSITPKEIQDLAAAYPDASYEELNSVLDCGIGRISEALAGFRSAA